jgi:spore coat polysaccharide biosynthesis protein SpsF
MIVAIIQARMGSTRLPGKVLKDVNGVPLLKLMVERVVLSKKIDRVIVATSTLSIDDKIVEFCIKEDIDVFRGSENDVLSRYYECATKLGATVIVRLTADCPLTDPGIIDDVIELFEDEGVDYAANTVPPESSTYPDGSDVEVFSYSALSQAHLKAREQADREHVTFYFWRDPLRGFQTAQLRQANDWSKYRLTVDYQEDLEVIKLIVNELGNTNNVPMLGEIIKLLENRPDICALNNKYYFGQGWSKK